MLVYYLAFRALPADLYDACRIEDLTPMQTWWRVAMPLVRPVTAAVAALTFVVTWSNFLDPLVYVYDRDLFTLPLALRSLATLDPTELPGLPGRGGARHRCRRSWCSAWPSGRFLHH